MQKVFQIIFLLFAVSLPAISGDVEGKEVINVSTPELKKMIDDKAVVTIVDTRSNDDFAAGHIPGAVHVSNFKGDEGSAYAGKLIFYCEDDTCSPDDHAASNALAAGYNYVYSYGEGYVDWVKHGYESTKN